MKKIEPSVSPIAPIRDYAKMELFGALKNRRPKKTPPKPKNLAIKIERF